MMADGQITVAVVDDEPPAVELISALLDRDSGIRLVARFFDGLSAARELPKHSPDLLFLDIQMPEMDGFRLLDVIGPDAVPAIVFVTAYDRYAIRAFEVNALDYLLKPFSDERFYIALERAKERLRLQRRDTKAIRNLLREMLSEKPGDAGSAPLKRLNVPTSDGIVVLPVEKIDWVEADKNYAVIHSGEKEYVLRESLSALEGSLDSREFARVHRSTIVRLDRVDRVRTARSGAQRIFLRDGTAIALGRTYQERFWRSLS